MPVILQVSPRRAVETARGRNMLDFLFVSGQVLCSMGCLYGAYLVIRHHDTFRAGVRVLRKIRPVSRDSVAPLRSCASGERVTMTAGAWSPSRVGFPPGTTAEEAVAAGGFLSRLRRRGAQTVD